MIVGQVLTQWWQDYVAGRFLRPAQIRGAALAENPDPAHLTARFFDEPQDSALWEAPQRLRAPNYVNSNAYLAQMEYADWQQTDPRLMRWAAMYIEMARKRGIPLYVHCAYRTEAEQIRAYAGGFSTTPYPRSAHNNGEAVDIVHGVYHWQLTKQEWAMLHVLGRLALDRLNADLKKADKLELTWGGDFKSLYDPAHWEVADYRARIKRRPTLPPVRMTPRGILSRVKF